MAWREAHSFIPNALPEAAPEALPETDQPAFPLPESQPALNSFTGTLETFPGKRATRQ
jgi:hypothetical protein